MAAAFPHARAHAVMERMHLDVGERHGAGGKPRLHHVRLRHLL
jgi:hypothetical protein